VTGDTVAYCDAGCVAVGEVVAACLREQGIRYEWGRVPGDPILVMADQFLSGLPGGGHHHEIPLAEDHRAFRSPPLPERAFDTVGENPVRLLNLAKVRRLNGDPPYPRGPVRRPRVGDRVKLGFLVWDAVDPLAREEGGDLVDRVQIENMWVEVTSVARQSPDVVYRGELLSVPLFIDPARLRIGSPVDFTADQVYPAEDGTGAGARR
jgi:hypothetical protein